MNLALEVIEDKPENFRLLDQKYKNKYEIASKAVEYSGHYIKYLSDELKDNENIVLLANRHMYDYFYCTSDRLKSDFNFVLKILKRHKEIFTMIPNSLRDEPEFILEAVKVNGFIVEYFKDLKIQITDEIAFEAIKSKGLALQWLPDKYSEDPRYYMIAIQNEPKTVLLLPNLMNDKKFILPLVKRCGYIYRHLPIPLKYDEEIILEAIATDPCLSYSVPIDKLSDESFILKLLNFKIPFESVPAKFYHNDRIMKICIKNNGYAICEASDRLKKNKKYVMIAIEDYPFYFHEVDDKLMFDHDVLKLAVQKYPPIFASLTPELRNDFDIAFTAIKEAGNMYKHASERLKNMNELVELTISKIHYAILFVPMQFLNEKIYRIALRTNIQSASYLPEDIKKNRKCLVSLASGSQMVKEYVLWNDIFKIRCLDYKIMNRKFKHASYIHLLRFF